jgi:oleate hydratase
MSEMKDMNDVQPTDRVSFTIYKSVIEPIMSFLRKEGVDFRTQVKVTDLETDRNGDVSKIKLLDHQGVEMLETVDKMDIVIVTLGSMITGVSEGSNSKPPASISAFPEDWQSGIWSLWFQLASKNSRYGAPSNFCPRIAESSLETFTVTLRGSEFFHLLGETTQDEAGSGKHISILGSNWGVNISIPQQPVFADQPDGVQVFWGYSLSPEKEGDYVKKPMFRCSGQEIMLELLSHLQFPIQSILPTSITIPCIFPQATSIMLPRAAGDRPEVIPSPRGNLAFVGQFVEIPDDTVFSMDYSVRSAQMAVFGLMGIDEVPKKITRSCFSTFEQLLRYNSR